MANPTMTLITSQTLATSISTVTFSSIPQTYTHLCMMISARDTVSNGGRGYIYGYMNGTTGNNYYSWMAGYDGGTQLAISTANGGVEVIGAIPDSTETANVFGNTVEYYLNYTNARYKSFLGDGVNENFASSPSMLTLSGGILRNTAAIGSISYNSISAFATGSTFYLYGISNS